MAVTVDCGEGKHDLCIGEGHDAYLIPQESRRLSEPPFACGCRCHHDGTGVPCRECGRSEGTVMADDVSRGLYEKYRVERTDGKPVSECIVLELKDPNAWPALLTWAATVEAAGYGNLATDVRASVYVWKQYGQGNPPSDPDKR